MTSRRLTLRPLDPLDPVRLLRAADGEEGVVWLDSGGGGEQGRWSYLMRRPVATLVGADGRWRLADRDGQREVVGDPLDLVDELTRAPVTLPDDAPPFVGGAVGFLGYDLLRYCEPATRTRVRPPAPEGDLRLGWYDRFVVVDHLTGAARMGVVAVDDAEREEGFRESLDWVAAARSLPSTPAPVVDPALLASDFSRGAYLAAVERIRAYIAAGDVYQVNLSQRFVGPRTVDPVALYEALRRENPAPFGAYIGLADGGALMSTSPERFLVVAPDGRVRSRPIKGTRRRGATDDDDRRLAEELIASEKERAENVMIVDLIRNDLSRVCRPGSVRVAALCALESFATVHHLTSTVEGRLADGVRFADLLRATFPCGSVTGAPKIRAMEIIDELEPVRRGAYCGAVGWLGRNGAADLSVAIRIAVAVGDRVSCHVGGGITWPSDPAEEYAETLAKGAPLLRGLGGGGPV